MNLYYWPKIKNYVSGSCFAIANSKEEAIEVILAFAKINAWNWEDSRLTPIEFINCIPILKAKLEMEAYLLRDCDSPFGFIEEGRT